MGNYENLFTPLRMGSIMLRNRIIAAPITKYGQLPSPADELEALAAKARGGAGMVILGSCAVNEDDALIHPLGGGLTGKKLPQYLEELSVIHQYGAKASVEIMHCGMFANNIGGSDPVGSYTFTRTHGDFRGHRGVEDNWIMDGRMVHGLDHKDMDRICGEFADTALIAKQLGFDAAMLHFAHGWLPAQFLSPFFNQRTDDFGGSFENRIRFPLMILERVRKAVGKDYPLDMRISGSERIEGGAEIDETVEFIKRAESMLDMVHVSSGLDKMLEQTTYTESPGIYPHLFNVEYAERIKRSVNIPVVTVGGITLPDEAEEIIASGKADAIALGRALIADPAWPEKARTGNCKQIVPCLRCLSCYGVATGGRSQGCAVNPRNGRELRLTAEEQFAPHDKKVVVIGGGPAGMKAAVAAASRGNHVTLFEKSNELGGLLKAAENDPIKQDILNLLKHLQNAVYESDIDLRLNCEATPAMISSLSPDRIIVAVGSEPIKPNIQGIDLPHVNNILEAHHDMDSIGRNVAIIGGGQAGCELGLTLARTGRNVTIIEATIQLAAAGNVLYREGLRVLIRDASSLTCLTETRCSRIVPEGIFITGIDGGERFLPADTVIYTVGMKAKKDLAESFYNLVYDVRLVGDCIQPRRINEAIHEGYFAGLFL